MDEDINDLRRDDALLDGVGSGRIQDGSDELTQLLIGWRLEILAEPEPELVTLEEAQVVIAASRKCDWWLWSAWSLEVVLYVLVLLVMLTLAVGI